MSNLLIIDKDTNLCEDVCNFFQGIGQNMRHASDYRMALQMIFKYEFDVVISDVNIPGGNILDLIRDIKKKNINTIVIVDSKIDTVQEGVRAVKEGAFGIVQKPFNFPELNFQIKKAIEKRNLAEQPQGLLQGISEQFKNIYQPYSFIGESPEILKVFNMVNRVARTNSSVIITGETGTGKELIAGAIHYNSHRSEGPFVRVNCAALPEQLLESELFGYEKGAFTGAEKRRIGRFEQANRGTIFLDEVADMSLFTQAKVLRIIQEKEFERLGSSETVKTDVRILSATNKDLRVLMEKDLFRDDLYYRLNVVTIHLPPLREREGDIKLLTRFFLKKYTVELNKKIRGMDAATLKMLNDYHWPGNIRELENAIERAAIMAEEDIITPDDLNLFFDKESDRDNDGQIKLPPVGIDLEEAERGFIFQALERTDFVQKEAAKLLGISSRVLNYKIKRFGITHPRWKQNI
jgi:two-component system response regulator AtoC